MTKFERIAYKLGQMTNTMAIGGWLTVADTCTTAAAGFATVAEFATHRAERRIVRVKALNGQALLEAHPQ